MSAPEPSIEQMLLQLREHRAYLDTLIDAEPIDLSKGIARCHTPRGLQLCRAFDAIADAIDILENLNGN